MGARCGAKSRLVLSVSRTRPEPSGFIMYISSSIPVVDRGGEDEGLFVARALIVIGNGQLGKARAVGIHYVYLIFIIPIGICERHDALDALSVGRHYGKRMKRVNFNVLVD